jgi:PadR family transcriptional regulator, regulatory protein PadR
MARQDALQGSLPLLVLKLLARRGPLHGYGIATQIETMSDETLRVEEGSLYPALHRLEEDGEIQARWTTTDTGRRARVYEITAGGRKRLESEEARWRTITAAVGKILKHA